MNKRVLFIRSGGLGDFVLILPLLGRALVLHEEVVLFTRGAYHSLARDFSRSLILKDLDSQPESLGDLLPGSDVISFWQDAEWKSELEAARAGNAHFLESRPTGNSHFCESAFSRLGWDWSQENFRKAWLGDRWKEGVSLWVHPGSGSVAKNHPLVRFVDLAEKWLEARNVNRVVFSFGEADDEVRNHFAKQVISRDERVRVFHLADLGELRDQMVEHASVFLGNDSGPGHLAASLGIPTRIFFRSTNPSTWSPLGPRVKTYESFSEVSRIL